MPVLCCCCFVEQKEGGRMCVCVCVLRVWWACAAASASVSAGKSEVAAVGERECGWPRAGLGWADCTRKRDRPRMRRSRRKRKGGKKGKEKTPKPMDGLSPLSALYSVPGLRFTTAQQCPACLPFQLPSVPPKIPTHPILFPLIPSPPTLIPPPTPIPPVCSSSPPPPTCRSSLVVCFHQSINLPSFCCLVPSTFFPVPFHSFTTLAFPFPSLFTPLVRSPLLRPHLSRPRLRIVDLDLLSPPSRIPRATSILNLRPLCAYVVHRVDPLPSPYVPRTDLTTRQRSRGQTPTSS